LIIADIFIFIAIFAITPRFITPRHYLRRWLFTSPILRPFASPAAAPFRHYFFSPLPAAIAFLPMTPALIALFATPLSTPFHADYAIAADIARRLLPSIFSRHFAFRRQPLSFR
jgi:hypothetical protein